MFKSINRFFPFQLLVVHFKRNQGLSLFWIFLFAVVTENLGYKFGIHSLFLAPEYLDKVNFWSFFIFGICIGGFIMAYNMSSYIINGYKFPFIVTLSNPFFKFSLNNSLIPLVFIIVYVIKSIDFQINYEFLSLPETLWNLLGFLCGTTLFITLSFTYFFSTNKDLSQMFGINPELKPRRKKVLAGINRALEKEMKRKECTVRRENTGQWKIETYLISPFQVKRARNFTHYSSDMIQKVLHQNHINAAFFAVGIAIAILVLRLFMNYWVFMIPAAASIMLVITLLVMIYSALLSILKGWGTAVILLVLVLVNISPRFIFSDYQNTGYGLSYEKVDSIRITEPDEVKDRWMADYEHGLKILENWKRKNYGDQDSIKPKLLVVNTSGGGLKAAIWTYYSLSYADSMTNGELLKHTQLITGASGGMIGAAYFREMYLKKMNGEIPSMYNDSCLAMLSSDLLNPLAFSMMINDWFFKFQKFEYNGEKYYKDRAYSFEEKLNKNTGNIFEKSLMAYQKPEENATIPMLIMNPTIINDGHSLVISSQPVSYLLTSDLDVVQGKTVSGIEFIRAYSEYHADSLRFSTALRMNATFPYVCPIVSLPGTPTLNVMDASLNDNFGVVTSIQFLYTFRKWIDENTSGIVILRLVDEDDSSEEPTPTILGNFLNHFGNIYSNLFNMQRIRNDRFVELTNNCFRKKPEIVTLQMYNQDEKISISWHLTKREKKTVIQSIHHPENQKELQRLRGLIGK